MGERQIEEVLSCVGTNAVDCKYSLSGSDLGSTRVQIRNVKKIELIVNCVQITISL